jgi:hypothetical protein
LYAALSFPFRPVFLLPFSFDVFHLRFRLLRAKERKGDSYFDYVQGGKLPEDRQATKSSISSDSFSFSSTSTLLKRWYAGESDALLHLDDGTQKEKTHRSLIGRRSPLKLFFHQQLAVKLALITRNTVAALEAANAAVFLDVVATLDLATTEGEGKSTTRFRRRGRGKEQTREP